MTISVHVTNPHFTEQSDPACVKVGHTDTGWVSYERLTDICGKTGQPGTAEFTSTHTHEFPRKVVRTTWFDICRLSPGHPGECTNSIIITDCCDRRVDTDLDDQTASNDEVTVCAWGAGCNKNRSF